MLEFLNYYTLKNIRNRNQTLAPDK